LAMAFRRENTAAMKSMILAVVATALVAVVFFTQDHPGPGELIEVGLFESLFIAPQANVLTGSGQRAVSAGTKGKPVQTTKVVHQKHAKHRWTAMQQKIAEQVQQEMMKQKEERAKKAEKEASADYWSNVRKSIRSEKHKQRFLSGRRALDQAMAEEQEADKQDEELDRTMQESRQLQERKSEMAQESEDAGENAFKVLSTHDNEMNHAKLYHLSETHCGSACQMARQIVS